MPLNEFDLINRYFKHLTAEDRDVVCAIGDDAAVIRPPCGMELLVATDSMVCGVHFYPDADPADIGFKSLAVNLSDMAAMGAEPRWVTLALTLPQADDAWLRGFAAGFAELARRYNVSLVGGDTTHGPLSITVQIVGLAPEGSAIRRSGARCGDRIYVSGAMGAAGYALRELAAGREPAAIPQSARQRLLRPEPRIKLGVALRGFATAAIDISDGLAADIGHILNASGVGAEIELERIPLAAALQSLPDPHEIRRTALGAGDDYELCFTVPEGLVSELKTRVAALDVTVSCIGRITSGGLQWLLADGTPYPEPLSGYRHF